MIKKQRPALVANKIQMVYLQYLLLDIEGDDMSASYRGILSPNFWLEGRL